MSECVDLSDVLVQELNRRVKTNPNYSLRAFARQLEVEPSALSKILRRKRRVSEQMFCRLCNRLGLSENERQSLRVHQFRNNVVPEKLQFSQISSDEFSVISDWLHFTILELTHIKNFQPSIPWVAGVLDEDLAVIEAAVERLRKLGYLTTDQYGRWVDNAGKITSSNGGITSLAHREHQKQILQGAIAAIDEVDIEERDNTTMTMAIDSSKLAIARERINRFRRELCAELSDNENCDDVFHVAIALFPATTTSNRRRN